MILYNILKIENALAKPVHNMTEYIICSLLRSAIIWLITLEGLSALVQCEISNVTWGKPNCKSSCLWISVIVGCQNLFCCEIFIPHVVDCYDCCPKVCETMQCSRQMPMFQKNLLPLSSRQKWTALFSVNADPCLGVFAAYSNRMCFWYFGGTFCFLTGVKVGSEKRCYIFYRQVGG
jgi:hypothetical protein